MKRREAVKLIALSGLAPAAPAQHTGHAAQAARKERTGAAAKTAPAAAAYKPKYFSAPEFAVISRLADLIIPRDATPGALDARGPEYIDFQVAEMPEAQVRLSGGIQWLDRYCTREFGQPFLECSAEQQKTLLDRLAFRKNVAPELRAGRRFFELVRDLTCDGFYSSKLGFAEVGYKGNVFLDKFLGCTHPEHGG